MTKAVPGYRAAHYRVQYARGKAKEFDCWCGCGRPAQEWALAIHEEICWENKPDGSLGRPYSLNVDNYVPMAIPCHRELDGNPPPVRWGTR